MKFDQFKLYIEKISFGKHLPEAIYIHEECIPYLPKELAQLIYTVSSALKISRGQWNLVKLFKRDFKFSLLFYPTFFDEPYPPLKHSLTIDLLKLTARQSNYNTSKNPPILHRREDFLPINHPQIDKFKEFTLEGEKIGLYQNTRLIGFKESWEKLIKRKGFKLDSNGHLRPLLYKPKTESKNYTSIERHKTAISRDKLSTPMFLLAQRGYLNGSYSILDYGCGRGDDLRELEAHGVNAIGWDPIYRPDVDIESSDIVNLGFVINVIEEKQEREETLIRAYNYAEKLLLVSTMLGNAQIYERFKPYRDGVITSRNTFQKYYTQGELQYFIESTLTENAIALAPGVFAVFKDKIEEQKYLLERQRTRHQWRQISSRPVKAISQKKSQEVFEKYQSLFEDFWYTCLDLGRLPANDEFEQSEHIRQVIGSHNKAFLLCSEKFDIKLFHRAQDERRNDLLVYFSLSFFSKRDSYARMPQSLQRDIKAFFGKYTEAREQGQKLLFSMPKVDVIHQACIDAHNHLPASQLNGSHDFVFHQKYLNQLPKELRVYIGCATQLYGELDNVSLIKTHIQSGKVSLMIYDDWEKDTPLLTERIKIKLREQDIDFFDYCGPFEPQPLENKHIFLE